MNAPARPNPASALVEYFTLQRAEKAGIVLGAVRRKEASDALAAGRQKAEAAETLWSNGHTAEGLRLAFASLDGTLEAAAVLAEGAPAVVEVAKLDPEKVAVVEKVEPAADAPADETIDAAKVDAAKLDAEKVEDPVVEPVAETVAVVATVPAWRRVLVARGTRPAQIERVSQALASIATSSIPVLDADVSPALAELFPRVMAARNVVEDAIASSAWSPNEIRWARVRRTSGVVLVLVAAIVGLYFGLHEPEGTFTSASDVWAQSPTFGTDMVIDGRPETSWLLPDRSTGWLEVRSSPPRRVERVILTNTANAPALDRAAQDYRLEIYAHGELARSIDGHFDWSDHPEPVTHEVGMDGVERVRFVLRSYHRTGGGLAEMHIE